MHAYARAATGFVGSFTFVGSFRHNGHTIATTNNRGSFNPLPGSETHIVRSTPADIIRLHRARVAAISDIALFDSFDQLTQAYDRKERMQADWDIARGVFAPASAP